jgi:uncharacterized protein (TIGR02266 family)
MAAQDSIRGCLPARFAGMLLPSAQSDPVPAERRLTTDDESRDESNGNEPADDGQPEPGKLRPRYAVNFDLTLNSDTYFYAGSATNLSDGGFFVATHIHEEIGERFQFTIRLPETNKMVKGVGEVRWHRHKDEGPEEPAGMGIRFVELEEGAQEAVDEYLAALEPLRWDSGS